MDDMGRVAFNGSLSTDAKVAQLVDICRGFVAQARVPALLDFASFGRVGARGPHWSML